MTDLAGSVPDDEENAVDVMTTTMVGDLEPIRQRWQRARPGLNAGRPDSAVLASAYDVPILLDLLEHVAEERDAAQREIRAGWRLAKESESP